MALTDVNLFRIDGDLGSVSNIQTSALNGGQLAGFRNVIINGNLTINQRGVDIASVTTGDYGQDRWKKTAGGMTQIIEEGNFEPSATYTLSGTGVTTQQLTAPASGNWTLPDIPVTARKIQLEPGPVATPFEHRPIGTELALCQRYFETSFNGGVSVNNTSNAGLIIWGGSDTGDTSSFIGNATVFFAVSKRSSPTVTIYDMANPRNTGKCSRHRLGIPRTDNQAVTTTTTTGINGFDAYSGGDSPGTGILFHFAADAEL